MNATPSFSLAGEKADRIITAMTNAAHLEAMHAVHNPLREKANNDVKRRLMQTRLADAMIAAEAEPVDQETFDAMVRIGCQNVAHVQRRHARGGELMSLPPFVILKSSRRPNAEGGGFFRSVSDTQLTDPIIADFECLECHSRFGFGVPLAQPEGFALPVTHLSCWISTVCSECGITTVNFIKHASNGMYRCADYFACARRKDVTELKARS